MIIGIMAVDEKSGISRGKSMPWPKNTKDLNWFKSHTLNNIVLMGRKTWEDPNMPTPLKLRKNVLVTNKNPSLFPKADLCISGDLNEKILDIEKKNLDKDIYIIGGSEIINLTFSLIQRFYLTRIYGNHNCEKFLNISLIEKNMKLIEKIDGDKSCHFEIWEK